MSIRMNKIISILMIGLSLSLIPFLVFGIVDERISVSDRANIIDSDNEGDINILISKLKNQTATPMYVLTVKSKKEDSSIATEEVLSNLNKLNAIVVIYYQGDESIDIQVGRKAAEILTPTVIESVQSDNDIVKTLSKNPGEGMEYLCTAIADKILVDRGFDSVLDMYMAEQENKNSDKWFFGGLIVVSAIVFFLTPKSPSQKLKDENSAKNNFTKGFGKF